MDARDNKSRLSDADIERLLGDARPEPDRLPADASRALFARALEQSGVTAPRRPSWWSVGAPRWTLAAATCVLAFAIARVAWEPAPPAGPDETSPVETTVTGPAAPSSDVKPQVATAPAASVTRRSSAPIRTAAVPRPRTWRPRENGDVTDRAFVPTTRKPLTPTIITPIVPVAAPPQADETLASLLIVTADNSPADMKASQAPDNAEGYARVATVDETEDGKPVVLECEVTRDENGELCTEFRAAEPGTPEESAYLKVEPASPPAP